MDMETLKYVVGLIDLNFVSILFVLGGLMWVLWCFNNRQDEPFKIVNFFKTNGHEDVTKLVFLVMTTVIAWTMIIEAKSAEGMELYKLLAYMAYGLGAPVFYALLKTITSILGKPDIVKLQAEVANKPPETK